jgi:hypothetical protein
MVIIRAIVVVVAVMMVMMMMVLLALLLLMLLLLLLLLGPHLNFRMDLQARFGQNWSLAIHFGLLLELMLM